MTVFAVLGPRAGIDWSYKWWKETSKLSVQVIARMLKFSPWAARNGLVHSKRSKKKLASFHIMLSPISYMHE
jgi:hypothetical protein